MTGVIAQTPEKMSSQAVVYIEMQNPATNANELMSIEIGSGTVVSGDFSVVDWSAVPWFIKTETDPAGGTNYTITGTSQLLCVPYALYAKKAESLVNANNIFSVSFTGDTLFDRTVGICTLMPSGLN